MTATLSVASFRDPCFTHHHILVTSASARNNIIHMILVVSQSPTTLRVLILVPISSFSISYASPPLSICGAVFTMELVAGHTHLPQMLPRRDKDSNADLCPRKTQLIQRCVRRWLDPRYMIFARVSFVTPEIALILYKETLRESIATALAPAKGRTYTLLKAIWSFLKDTTLRHTHTIISNRYQNHHVRPYHHQRNRTLSIGPVPHHFCT